MDEKQRVWRTTSSSENSGFFVWEVMEVMGEPTNKTSLIECRDGSFVLIWCNHFFSKEQMEIFVTGSEFDRYQEMIDV